MFRIDILYITNELNHHKYKIIPKSTACSITWDLKRNIYMNHYKHIYMYIDRPDGKRVMRLFVKSTNYIRLNGLGARIESVNRLGQRLPVLRIDSAHFHALQSVHQLRIVATTIPPELLARLQQWNVEDEQIGIRNTFVATQSQFAPAFRGRMGNGWCGAGGDQATEQKQHTGWFVKEDLCGGVD